MQTYARTAGILILVSFVAGGFGEVYAPSKLIVAGDAAATANNILSSSLLYRCGFAGYLVEAICDVWLTLLFYVLLKPAGRNLALAASLFRLLGTAVFAAAELFYLGPALILHGGAYLNTFSSDQMATLAMLSLRMYGHGSEAMMAFGGIGSVLVGLLIYRSTYLPKFLGVLSVLGGVGFVVNNFVLILAPSLASPWLLAPASVSALALAIWLLVKGVDAAQWEARAGDAAWMT